MGGTHDHLLLILCALVKCSSIEEITRSFPCPEKQETFHIEHGIENPEQKKCQQTWIQGDKVIGIRGSESQCLQPCVNISDQGMSVSACANYTFSAFCENNERKGYEILISFCGNAVKRPQGSVAPAAAHTVRWGSLCAFVFIAAVSGASALWYCYCHRGEAGSASSGLCDPPQRARPAPLVSVGGTP